MFEGWHEYYLTIGAAAGALIGLLFVVVTLTSDFERSKVMRAVGIYMTPTALHFTLVLALSGLALAPRLGPQAVGGLVLLAAAAGTAMGLRAAIGIRGLSGEETAPHWSDFWAYGAAPTALYVGLAVVGWGFLDSREGADYGLAGAVMLMMLLGIRNAWDLITWMAPKSKEKVAEVEAHAKAGGRKR